jgi:hypothetical protein
LFCEGDADYHSILAEVGRRSRVRTFCLQWGIFYKDWSEIAFSNIRTDYFLAWGKYFLDEMCRRNPGCDVLVYGYPPIVSSVEVSMESKRSILFLAQGVLGGISHSHFNQYCDLMFQLQKALPPDTLIYKPHPTVRDPCKEKLIRDFGIHIDETTSLAALCSKSVICVGITTSSLVEALLYNCIPVSFTPGDEVHSFPFERFKVGVVAHDLLSAKGVILDLVKNSELRKSYIERFTSVREQILETPKAPLYELLRHLSLNRPECRGD